MIGRGKLRTRKYRDFQGTHPLCRRGDFHCSCLHHIPMPTIFFRRLSICVRHRDKLQLDHPPSSSTVSIGATIRVPPTWRPRFGNNRARGHISLVNPLRDNCMLGDVINPARRKIVARCCAWRVSPVRVFTWNMVLQHYPEPEFHRLGIACTHSTRSHGPLQAIAASLIPGKYHRCRDPRELSHTQQQAQCSAGAAGGVSIASR